MKAKPKPHQLKQLIDCGQSVWMDTISRDMIENGQLKYYIKECGISGVTSNPDIFLKAITGSTLYDAQIRKLAKTGRNAAEIYEELVVDDVRRTADMLRPVFDTAQGQDGFVSLEVSSCMAFDTKGTVAEAMRLWKAVNRPNLLVKVPATLQGIPAIRELVARGLNINVTLIFSLQVYDDIMHAYIEGLEERVKAGLPIDKQCSVASFFLSRIDTLVDKLLGNRLGMISPTCDLKHWDSREKSTGREGTLSASQGNPCGCSPQSLFGTAANASAKLAYRRFKSVFSGNRFEKLRAAGARVQRPLWASTSAKNPTYSKLKYLEPLIGRDSINTLPISLIHHIVLSINNGDLIPQDTIENQIDESGLTLEQLKHYGIDMDAVSSQLLEEGVTKFIQSYETLLERISIKRLVVFGYHNTQTESIGHPAEKEYIEDFCDALSEARLPLRLWCKDESIWTDDPQLFPLIADRLGWLDVPAVMLEKAADIKCFASAIKKRGFKHVVLLGMGGSSLCPEVCAKTFGSAKGYPELLVLDNTSPSAISRIESKIDLKRTLFLPASKSGTTVETNTMMHYFMERLKEAGSKKPGSHFVAITDPGSSLAELGKQWGFLRVFENPSDIGGRYSALSLFGLVPMALIGIDIKVMLERVLAFIRDGGIIHSASADSAIRLGVIMGALGRSGQDKINFAISPRISSLGDWIEQLIAESTGKRDCGLLPVVGERPELPSLYRNDQVFVSICLAGDRADERRLSALETAGFSVIRIIVNDPADLGVEFMRWELATATAGAILKINPFDEPNVTESKQNTSTLLKEYSQTGSLPFPEPDWSAGDISISLSRAIKTTFNDNPNKSKDPLRTIIESVNEGDYLAMLAFLGPDRKAMKLLGDLRPILRNLTRCAITLGTGPRYLHSTGQLHKGGPNKGVFLMFMTDQTFDPDIPNYDYSFGTLFHAQALGDFRSLDDHERRAALIRLGGNPVQALKHITKMLISMVPW
ncbi:MAG: bifunctional transaldolase/phosoglucose isomerase [bacterium]|nr:bifunctional transaldolase/phosoglucose isomerase [Candidatus Sumerlaeota bacterium]